MIFVFHQNKEDNTDINGVWGEKNVSDNISSTGVIGGGLIRFIRVMHKVRSCPSSFLRQINTFAIHLTLAPD